ncbi:MAG: sugar kinase [Hyphomonadaceae bacterium]|nr:sugar kinase [Hyphomonadaceae bacterium]
MATFVCFGEILLRLSAPGGELLLQSPGLRTHVGGAEANVAVSLARFGHDARMASTLPNNALGNAARDELRRYGVDTSVIRFADGRMGLYFLTPGAGQRPSDIVYDRAGSAFAADTSAEIIIPNGACFHTSGISFAVGAEIAALAAMDAAHRNGTTVSFDSNFRAKLWADRKVDPRPLLKRAFENCHILFADQRDIALVTGQTYSTAQDAAQAAFAMAPKLEVLAFTERTIVSADHHELSGMLLTRQDAIRSKPHTVAGIVDRIGGGDAFAAGVLHGRASGWDSPKTIDFATGAAVLKHYIAGDFNLSTADDVDFYLSQSGADVRR